MHFTTNTAVNSVGETLCVCDNNASITIVHKLNVYLMFTCSLSKCCLQLCIVGVECSIRPYLCVSDDITIRIYLVTPGPYIYRKNETSVIFRVSQCERLIILIFVLIHVLYAAISINRLDKNILYCTVTYASHIHFYSLCIYELV